MIHWMFTLFQTYPEVFAGAVGISVAIILTEVARMVYFPKDWDITDQWRAIIPIDLFASFAITHALWRFLDVDHDSQGLRLVGSICFGIACLGIHVFGLRFALHRWPWIGDVDPNPPAGGKP
jgi:heme/copper-type cytochrome/quinol oxidase subunit 4